MNQWRLSWQKFIFLTIAICWLILVSEGILALAQPSLNSDFPAPKVHSLPESLANWQDLENQGDYFGQIESTSLGYLVWSQFPLQVYIQQPNSFTDSAADRRFQQWVVAVKSAIAEWNIYLPLEIVSDPEIADIAIWRSQPEREVKLNPDTGLFDIPRAVAAETSYKFYLQQNPPVIAHKMAIHISPNFAGISLLATVRHELGHALGIWGHSPKESDALYFSQVSDPPPISPRDINTLKKIYQQPTRLGWKIGESRRNEK